MTLPATEVQTLAEGNYAVNASVSDRAGNATSNSVNFTVDTGAPVVSVNTVAGDDILNNAEQAVAQIISGQVSGASPCDTVTVKLGTHVLTGVVLADGNATVTASVNDVAGNPSSVSRVVLVVLLALPLLVITVCWCNARWRGWRTKGCVNRRCVTLRWWRRCCLLKTLNCYVPNSVSRISGITPTTWLRPSA